MANLKSKVCKDKMSTKPRKRYRPAWRDDPRQVWSRAVKRRDKVCQACSRRVRLHAHHVLPASMFPDLALEVHNGISLCQFHHVELHRARLDVELIPELYLKVQQGARNIHLVLRDHHLFKTLVGALVPKRMKAYEILRVAVKDYPRAIAERWPDWSL